MLCMLFMIFNLFLLCNYFLFNILLTCLLVFSLGGITGLILANCLINTLLHDSYFVVAHFHYVLSLGAIYSLFSALINYLGFCGQRFYNNMLGSIFFVLFFIKAFF
jgi:cytochrome c oxidase subunit 1